VIVDGVTKSFDGKLVLDRVSLSVEKGEFLAIVGPNGSGKTTLLRVIAGVLKPDSGRVEVRGRIGMVPQENLLLPWKKIGSNIELGLKFHRVPKEERVKKVREMASFLGIEEYLDLYPWKVSGGVARKAAIARALVLDPDILLLDEPLTGLDVPSRRNLTESLTKLRGRITVILVTHSMEEVFSLADRVAMLTPRPARVASVFRTDEISERELKLLLTGIITSEREPASE